MWFNRLDVCTKLSILIAGLNICNEELSFTSLDHGATQTVLTHREQEPHQMIIWDKMTRISENSACGKPWNSSNNNKKVFNCFTLWLSQSFLWPNHTRMSGEFRISHENQPKLRDLELNSSPIWGQVKSKQQICHLRPTVSFLTPQEWNRGSKPRRRKKLSKERNAILLNMLQKHKKQAALQAFC